MNRAAQLHSTHEGCSLLRQRCSRAKHAQVPGDQQLCSEACIMTAGGRGGTWVIMEGHGSRMESHSSRLQLHALQLSHGQAPCTIRLRSTGGPMPVTCLGDEHMSEQSQQTTPIPT